jgi:hypothetical protein
MPGAEAPFLSGAFARAKARAFHHEGEILQSHPCFARMGHPVLWERKREVLRPRLRMTSLSCRPASCTVEPRVSVPPLLRKDGAPTK